MTTESRIGEGARRPGGEENTMLRGTTWSGPSGDHTIVILQDRENSVEIEGHRNQYG